MNSSLNPDGVEPLYKQLKDVILDAIYRKELKHYQKIPSEAALAEKYNISRITVRNAITELVEEGVLIRKQGKGTFVSGATLERDFKTIVGYSESMKIQGYTPSRVILEKKIVHDDSNLIRPLLNIKEAESFIYIKRLLLANDEPLILENTYYPLKYSILMEKDISNISTYQLLKDSLGIAPFKAQRTIGTHFADKETAKLLGVKERASLLVIHENVYLENGEPLHYSVSYAVSSKTRIKITAYAPTSDDFEGYLVIPSEDKK